MLVLERMVGESICIAGGVKRGGVTITVTDIGRNHVKLGFAASRETVIHREEVQRIVDANLTVERRKAYSDPITYPQPKGVFMSLQSLVFANRERPLIDFIREVIPKIKDALANVDIDGLIAMVKQFIDFAIAIGLLQTTTAAASATDDEIEDAVRVAVAEADPHAAVAFDLAKLIELIKLLISIFWKQPTPTT